MNTRYAILALVDVLLIIMKHYHSIHARGEKVEDAIKSHLEKDGQK